MKKILAFNGSPRRNGNTSLLLNSFMEGAMKNSHACEQYVVEDLNIDHCRGCLRCNLLRKCSMRGDDWEDISQEILKSDVLVLASPVYFHHLTAPLKKMIDRFRSFINVQITESGLNHTPWTEWNKDFVLLLSMGSPDYADAKPIIDLFEFMTKILGPNNRLHIIAATRLAVVRQIEKTEKELEILYPKLNLSTEIVKDDYARNQMLLRESFRLGEKLSK